MAKKSKTVATVKVDKESLTPLEIAVGEPTVSDKDLPGAPESQIQGAIIKALNKIPTVKAQVHTATAYSGKGHPDIYGTCGGVSFFCEVKRPGYEPTKIQTVVLQQWRDAGAFTSVWTSVQQAVADIRALQTNVKVVTRHDHPEVFYNGN